MDIETDTSWYIYGNQKMATRSILKAVSVWRLSIRSHIFSIYGVKGSIIEIRKPKLYPLPRKKYHLHMINLGRKKLKYLFPNKVVHACFSRLTVSYYKYSHVLEYISEKISEYQKNVKFDFFFKIYIRLLFIIMNCSY